MVITGSPTITPELNPVFSILFLIGIVILVVVEVIGIKSPKAGDTLTEHWRFADRWLKNHKFGWLRWAFRVWTAGMLLWACLHFLAGTS